MFSYCSNNPVSRIDNNGAFWDTLFDVVSLVVSVVDVIRNPDDPLAWAGLAGDAIDLIPFVSCVGETIRGINAADNIIDAVKTADRVVEAVDTVDDIHDVVKVADNTADSISAARSRAVREAWQNEFNDVASGGNGISRVWDVDEIDELLTTGKVKGYQGHHMKSVKGYPELAGDPSNIQFLKPKDHLKAHGGNWRNITHGAYIE